MGYNVAAPESVAPSLKPRERCVYGLRARESLFSNLKPARPDHTRMVEANREPPSPYSYPGSTKSSSRFRPRHLYMESRPMANPPQGAPRKPGAKATKKKGRTKRATLQASVSVVPEVEASAVPEGEPDAVNPDVPLMTAEAREESARIHWVEREQRELRAKMLQREKEMVEAARAKQGAGRGRNGRPVETLLMVPRPFRAAKAALHPDGSPVIRHPNKCGEMRMAEELGAKRDLHAKQVARDAALLKAGTQGKAANAAAAVPRLRHEVRNKGR
ncbi:hypothetical protein B0H14DRAFT_3474137 [Mycena olivaceomarginata]|nr:hypothetical protein B0H14DRAFT_3474137 [Mycena olivaceomarginata]